MDLYDLVLTTYDDLMSKPKEDLAKFILTLRDHISTINSNHEKSITNKNIIISNLNDKLDDNQTTIEKLTDFNNRYAQELKNTTLEVTELLKDSEQIPSIIKRKDEEILHLSSVLKQMEEMQQDINEEYEGQIEDLKTNTDSQAEHIKTLQSNKAYSDAADMINADNKQGYVDLCTELEYQNKFMKDKLLFTIDNLYKNYEYIYK